VSVQIGVICGLAQLASDRRTAEASSTAAAPLAGG